MEYGFWQSLSLPGNQLSGHMKVYEGMGSYKLWVITGMG